MSDPIVAPFNPVQDRHVGQRNVSVVQVAPSRYQLRHVLAEPGLTAADTLLEVQKLEGAALATLASALGRDVWTAAGGGDVDLSRPERMPERPHPQSHALATGKFRETLQDLPPTSEARRVMGVLQSSVAPRKPRRDADAVSTGSTVAPADRSKESGDQRDFDRAVAPPGRTRIPLNLAPGQHVRATFRATLPRLAPSGAADVWRISRTHGWTDYRWRDHRRASPIAAC